MYLHRSGTRLTAFDLAPSADAVQQLTGGSVEVEAHHDYLYVEAVLPAGFQTGAFALAYGNLHGMTGKVLEVPHITVSVVYDDLAASSRSILVKASEGGPNGKLPLTLRDCGECRIGILHDVVSGSVVVVNGVRSAVCCYDSPVTRGAFGAVANLGSSPLEVYGESAAPGFRAALEQAEALAVAVVALKL